MNAWQVDQMEADARNHQWEELNAPDPYAHLMKKAATSIESATYLIDTAENRLYDAIAQLSGTPMADKVQYLVEELMDLHIEIYKLSESYAKGCRG